MLRWPTQPSQMRCCPASPDTLRTPARCTWRRTLENKAASPAPLENRRTDTVKAASRFLWSSRFSNSERGLAIGCSQKFPGTFSLENKDLGAFGIVICPGFKMLPGCHEQLYSKRYNSSIPHAPQPLGAGHFVSQRLHLLSGPGAATILLLSKPSRSLTAKWPPGLTCLYPGAFLCAFPGVFLPRRSDARILVALGRFGLDSCVALA